jgi:hypothetical protein
MNNKLIIKVCFLQSWQRFLCSATLSNYDSDSQSLEHLHSPSWMSSRGQKRYALWGSPHGGTHMKPGVWGACLRLHVGGILIMAVKGFIHACHSGEKNHVQKNRKTKPTTYYVAGVPCKHCQCAVCCNSVILKTKCVMILV